MSVILYRQDTGVKICELVAHPKQGDVIIYNAVKYRVTRVEDSQNGRIKAYGVREEESPPFADTSIGI